MRIDESHVLHVAGAVGVAATGGERHLLSARAGTIALSAGVAAAPGSPGAAAGPFVAITNGSPVALPFVQELAGRDSRGRLDVGRTTIRLAAPDRELAILQLQIGPIPAGASEDQERGSAVVTLVVSAERPALAPGIVSFVAQAIGA
ncbi:MAG: hypothetical protein ACLP8S_22040 [Solirubrobacteraceae bacterium]|jgi:hypothetical protein